MDWALEQANAAEAHVLLESAARYDKHVSDVIRKHKGTLARIRELEKQEAYDRIRVIARTSGILNDLAEAIAQAGQESAVLIREALTDIKGVMADDDGSEA
jgi:hypothetical protein